MINTVYLDTAAQIARAAMSGTALPSITGKLLSHLPITAIFFAGETIIVIDDNSGKCVIKPKDAPAGAPSLIDTTAELVEVGSETHYLFEWPLADSAELRAYLDAQADPSQPVEMRCEIEYAIDGETARIAFPMLMQTSYTRPEDPAPSAVSDTSWDWLKARELAGEGVVRTVNDESKTLTWSAPGIETNAAAIAEEALARAAADTTNADAIALKQDAASAFDGAYGSLSGVPSSFPPSAHAHALSDVDGLTEILEEKLDQSQAFSGAYADLSGKPDLASQAEAEAGTNNTNLMTPERTAQAIAALVGGGSALPRGYIAGFTTVYANGTSFAVGSGVCRDSTDTYDIRLPSGFGAKAPNTAWAAGDIAGCSDGTGWAAGTNYSVWVILNPTSGAVDILTSTSASSPTLPAGFTVMRRIGWVRTLAASANMVPWTQFGDLFIRNATTTEYSAGVTTSTAPVTMATPPNVLAILCFTGGATSAWSLRISPTYNFTTAILGGFSCGAGAANATDSGQVEIFTDASSQIYVRAVTANTITVSISCHAWKDRRGQDD